MQPPSGPARLLWDQGKVWSLMSLSAAERLGLPLSPISAAEVAEGGLAGARLLVVPGGYPAAKKAALGQRGAAQVRRFIEHGGVYLGFCGGAGLALKVTDGLGLVNLTRAGGSGRVPSLSGPIQVIPAPGHESHPIWQDQPQNASFQVWWPGQFSRQPAEGVEPLALYGRPAPGLFSSDLEVARVADNRWPGLEADYGLNLNPAVLRDQPAVVEASLGAGRLILSYLHLDTPGDAAGARALLNLWRELAGLEPIDQPPAPTDPAPCSRNLLQQARELWAYGESLGLWRERGLALPIWRRGARGLEFWTLAKLTTALCLRMGRLTPDLDRARRMEAMMNPIWQQGRLVLAAQASRLNGEEPPPEAAGLDKLWFPAPRRMGGPLSEALERLEVLLFELSRS